MLAQATEATRSLRGARGFHIKGIRAAGRRDGPEKIQQSALKQDDFSSNHHPALLLCWSMIFSENRYPLFGIML
jgi:hypothetical protein